jgi:hypothetical protein
MTGTLKRCPSCGKFFTCRKDEDCWCEKFQIHKKDFLRLRQDYTDCICADCLANYAEP